MMAFRYMECDRDQLFLLPPSMREWLGEDHLVWLILDVVEVLDTSGLHRVHANDGPGRPAWDPDMMLALLVYAYCVGLRSSRRIEAACRSDVAFRVICANRVPDFRTVARFRAASGEVLVSLFVGVLVLCAKAGLVRVGRVALDGTKMAANASLGANRSAAAIRAEVEQMLAQAARADDSEDSRWGEGGGDELPGPLARAGSRLARLRQAQAQIDAEEAAERAGAEAKAARAAERAARGRKPAGRRPTRDARARLARAEADLAALQARMRAVRVGVCASGGLAVEVARAQADVEAARLAVQAAPPGRPRQANVTDPDSRIVKTPGGGWVQGYNAQAMVDQNQIVLAFEVTQDPNDVAQFQPLLAAAQHNLRSVGVVDPVGVVLADAGYWSEANATSAGPARLIATQKDWKQRQAARLLGTTSGPPDPDASPLEAMEHRLRTPEGAHAYAHRSATIEPVFGHTKHNRGITRFMQRGLHAVRAEWSLICATANLQKLHAHLPPGGLAALPPG